MKLKKKRGICKVHNISYPGGPGGPNSPIQFIISTTLSKSPVTVFKMRVNSVALIPCVSSRLHSCSSVSVFVRVRRLAIWSCESSFWKHPTQGGPRSLQYR